MAEAKTEEVERDDDMEELRSEIENILHNVAPELRVDMLLKLLEGEVENALEQAHKEIEEAAEHINDFLQEIPLNPSPHNWLIRNGFKDESYQADIYGQEIHKEI